MNAALGRAIAARFSPLLLISLALFAAACGSNNNSKAAAPTTAPSAAVPVAAAGSATSAAAPAATMAVAIQNTAFPAQISVKPGTTVTWTNKDSFPHTVTADTGQPEMFDSKPIDPNGTFSFTFAKAGTYAYHCNIHASMHGTVVVGNQAAGVSTPAPAAPSKSVEPGYKY